MGHPLLEEFCRAKTPDLRPDFFRRCQRVFRDEVNPVYDEGVQSREVIGQKDAEIAELKAKLESLQTRSQKRRAETEVSAS